MADEDEYLTSVFDGDKNDDDLWFIQPPEEEEQVKSFRFDAEEWLVAQSENSHLLAEATLSFGVFDALVKRQPLLQQQIALKQTEWVMRSNDIRLSLEDIALRDMMSYRGNGLDLTIAHSFKRRLLSSLKPLDCNIRDLLGRGRIDGETQTITHTPIGQQFDDLYEEWHECVKNASIVNGYSDNIHSFTLAAFSFFVWQHIAVTGESIVDGMIVSSKIALPRRQNNISFVPILTTHRNCVGRVGTTSQRVSKWYEAIREGCRKGVEEAEKIELFFEEASKLKSEREHGIIEQICSLFAEMPYVNVSIITNKLGVTKATALKHIRRLEDAELIREISGNNKFRFWMVANLKK